MLWTFHTIPQAGEAGVETWNDESWKYTGNTGVWTPFTADVKLGYVYLPVEAATGDFYGGHRHGDNLFADNLWIGAYGEGFPHGSLGGPNGLPLLRPHWGRITAINLNSGDHVWMVPNSETPDWARNNPALAGLTIPRTGSFDQVGLLVTRTLLFSGEGSGLWRAGGGGNKLRAHDKATGAILHEFTLPAKQSGVPMTHAVDGRQYIVVAVGAKGVAGELVALTLP